MTNTVRSKQDWQVSKTNIKDRFKELLLLSQWTDCTFSVGDENIEIITCHKLVLAVSSPVFEALFYGGLCNKDEVISVPDIQPYIFKQFLMYIYSDSLDLKTVEDAGGLLYVAKKYLMPQLARICIDYLLESTGIKTMWDILLIAEALNEEELLSICLKVMASYPYEVWSSENEHMSRNTLSKLLDQKIMNMREIELWKLVLDWCQKECQLSGIKSSPDNMRSVLDSMDVLKKIRFLALPLKEFVKVRESGILKRDECDLLESLIMKKVGLIEDFPMHLNPEYLPRTEVKPLIWRCNRELVKGDRSLICSGPMKTKLKSQSKVLVTGFEVVTRSSTISYSCGLYRERIVAVVEDDKGNMLTEVEHDGNAEFNSFQTVYLKQPIWFEANTVYNVRCIFSTGVYPLCCFSSIIRSKGTTFEFDDKTEAGNFVTKGSFITSILYSI
ncbi:BTB/POZ domain-containing protein 6-like [Cimex lectularius]|uniref:BTB domain-containing protein n=1 Tax=Cimex lectularius TaxID=79782 RepID=A0A8I6RTC3_CIMLE|nr:BTB/POZ domain-containing protein 6-like [Cimex lectularius]XP_014249788.1 BTB/POZ domain-containing protein 6-like [Cimex lectularius]